MCDTYPEILINAIRDCDEDNVSLLLEHSDVDVNRKDCDGNTALHHAIMHGSPPRAQPRFPHFPCHGY